MQLPVMTEVELQDTTHTELGNKGKGNEVKQFIQKHLYLSTKS